MSWLIFLEFCRVNSWVCAWLVGMVSGESVGAVPTHLPRSQGKEMLQTAHPQHG